MFCEDAVGSGMGTEVTNVTPSRSIAKRGRGVGIEVDSPRVKNPESARNILRIFTLGPMQADRLQLRFSFTHSAPLLFLN